MIRLMSKQIDAIRLLNTSERERMQSRPMTLDLMLRAYVYCTRCNAILLKSESMPVRIWAKDLPDFSAYLPGLLKVHQLDFCPHCAKKRGMAYAVRFWKRNCAVTFVDESDPRNQYRPSDVLGLQQ